MARAFLLRDLVPALALCLLLPAPLAAQTDDNAPIGLAASAQLRHDKGESWTYAKPELNLTRYRSVLIQPTVVYTGADAQFENIAAADRRKYADLLTQALRSELATFPGLAPRAGRDVLEIRLTLLGAEKTQGGVSTVTHVMPIGLVSNAVKSAAGKRGSMMGSVLLAIEVNDATTNELLFAAVRREAPDALDIPATVSTEATVKAVADSVAERVRKRLERAMHRSGK
jgi:hypothetical protein